VREETRHRVLTAIQELGFRPNIAARQLSGGKTYTVGVVTPFFTYPSFVERLAGIQDVLDTSTYDLVLYSIRYPDQFQRQLRNLVSQSRVDGLIILSLPFDENEIFMINPSLPVVAVDNDVIERYPHIQINNVGGGMLAANYLIQHGHREIGFIGDLKNDAFGFTSAYQRSEGVQMALKAAQLENHEEWYLFGEHSQASARELASQILHLPYRPTALVAANDTLAFGILAAANDLGLHVPQDIAVIGFDDIRSAEYLNLTTIKQHLEYSGRLGAQLMLEWLKNGTLPYQRWETILPLEIVERATV
jgi:DNA-binding LacI/PurR family transcriptional regulator